MSSLAYGLLYYDILVSQLATNVLKMELTYSFESLVHLRGHTVHNPENHNLNVYRFETSNLAKMRALFEELATSD
jgi:hypothetical protein